MIKENLKKKVRYYKFFVYFVMVAIIGKLTYIQIINYEKVNELANESWNRTFPLSASRGVIYDRNFNELASNVASMSLYVIPRQIENKEQTYRSN